MTLHWQTVSAQILFKAFLAWFQKEFNKYLQRSGPWTLPLPFLAELRVSVFSSPSIAPAQEHRCRGWFLLASIPSLRGLCFAERVWACLLMEHGRGTPQVPSGRRCSIGRTPTPVLGCRWAEVPHVPLWQTCTTVGLVTFFPSLLGHFVFNWICIVAFLLQTVPLLWDACSYSLSFQFRSCQGAVSTLAS